MAVSAPVKITQGGSGLGRRVRGLLSAISAAGRAGGRPLSSLGPRRAGRSVGKRGNAAGRYN